MLPRYTEPKPYSGIRSIIADIVIEQAENGNAAAWEVIQAAKERKRYGKGKIAYALKENEKADAMAYMGEYLKWEKRRHFTVTSFFDFIAWKKGMNPWTYKYPHESTIYEYWPQFGGRRENGTRVDKTYHDEQARGAAIFLETLIGAPVSKRRWNTRKALQVWNSTNACHIPHSVN